MRIVKKTTVNRNFPLARGQNLCDKLAGDQGHGVLSTCMIIRMVLFKQHHRISYAALNIITALPPL